MIKAVVPVRIQNALLKVFRVRGQIQERELQMNPAVKVIEKITPAFKDGGLVVILRQLVIDVLKLDGFCVIAVGDTADAVRPHPLIWNGFLLCSLRNTVVFSCPFHNSFNFSLLLPIQICRHFDVSCLWLLFEKQFVQPPFPVCTDASKRHNSCPSDKGEPWDERIWSE